MSSISIQFYVLLDELAKMVEDWQVAFDLSVVGLQLFPNFGVFEISRNEDLLEILRKDESVYSLCLGFSSLLKKTLPI
jgi:hypothetical protein